MDSEAKMSLSSVCTARAMAIPPTPRLATMAVMSTPRLARIDSSIMVQTTMRIMMPMMVVVTGLRARSEERRVGKECVSRVDLGGRRIIKKKKEKNKEQDPQYTTNNT